MLDPKENKAKYNKAKRLFGKNSEKFNALRGVEGEQRAFEKLSPFEQYERLSGEVEARNVQTRLNMTPAERRATPPWKTEDVPRSEQILKFGGAGASLSALAALTPEQAQANTQRQKEVVSNMLSDSSLKGLPSFTTATAPLIDQQKLPSHLRARVGGIEGPSQLVPSIIHKAGGALDKVELPVVGKPFEGVADYLRNFGFDDSNKERFKRAVFAALDVI